MAFRAFAFLLCLAAPAWMRASGPCPQDGVALAQAPAGRVASSGPYTANLEFRLPKPGRVWAEADGLRGLSAEDRDLAPEVFIDDTYLGPLLVEQGDQWRSPQALDLGPGPHWLVVRSAQEGEGPTLRWSVLRVMGDAPCPPSRARHLKPAPARGRAAGTCAQPMQRRDWPLRLGTRPLILSAPGGKLASSGVLVRLRPGDTWKARIKIPKDSGGQALPLLASFEVFRPGAARFLVRMDHDAPAQVQAVALGYGPGLWEPLDLTLCGGKLELHFAQVPVITRVCKDPSLDFEVAAQDMELRLAPFSH